MSDADFRWYRSPLERRRRPIASYLAGSVVAVAGLAVVLDLLAGALGRQLGAEMVPPAMVPPTPARAGLALAPKPSPRMPALDARIRRPSDVGEATEPGGAQLLGDGRQADGRQGGVLAAHQRWWRRQETPVGQSAVRRHLARAVRNDRPTKKPQELYRTVCVRLCDGAYFPVSFATTRAQFGRDSDQCISRCLTPSRLYVYPVADGSPATMTSVDGVPYGKLEAAFKFRTVLTPGCACRPEPWSEAALQRHRTLAADSGKPSAVAATSPPQPRADGLHGPGMVATLEVPLPEARMYASRFAVPFRAASVIFDATGTPATQPSPAGRTPFALSILSQASPDVAADSVRTPAGSSAMVATADAAQPATAPVSSMPPPASRQKDAVRGGAARRAAAAGSTEPSRRAEARKPRSSRPAYATGTQHRRTIVAWRSPDQMDWRQRVFIPN